MTDIEQEARDLLNAVRDRDGGPFDPTQIEYRKALCEALEQRNAVQKELDDFRREVSDYCKLVKEMLRSSPDGCINWRADTVPFILPDPIDPRVAALREYLKSRGISDPNDDVLADDFARLEAILAKHGGEVVFKGNDAP